MADVGGSIWQSRSKHFVTYLTSGLVTRKWNCDIKCVRSVLKKNIYLLFVERVRYYAIVLMDVYYVNNFTYT
ncbi:MAG: hypothetical protein HW387_818 [Parachlamydiales bacterium]|nr:hypothetical protein [Parachlamydiales bacterium]